MYKSIKSASIILIALLSVLSASCSKSDSHKVKVSYINKTGIDLTGLKIGDQRIGRLNSEEESKTILYDEYIFSHGQPRQAIRAKYDGEYIGTYPIFNMCGTMTNYVKVEEGTFEIEIYRWVENDVTYLGLELN